MKVKDEMELVWDDEGLFSIAFLFPFTSLWLVKCDSEDSGLVWEESLCFKNAKDEVLVAVGRVEAVGWVEDNSPSCEY